MYLILGCILKEGQWAVVGPATAGILAVSWRCLYAEITNTRIHHSQVNLKRALARVFQLTITRLKAHGLKWRRWVIKNFHTNQPWLIPESRREPGLIKHDFDGCYTIDPKLLRIVAELTDPTFQSGQA